MADVTPEIRVFERPDDVAQAAAERVAHLAAEAIAERGQMLWALAGGSTPRATYQHLAQAPLAQAIRWDRVQFFWGDERCVPPDHPDSNFRMARLALLDPLGLSGPQIHRWRTESNELPTAAAEYQLALAQAAHCDPAGPPPALDLVLLGLGGDGHTASLFPDSPALEETRQWTAAHFVPSLGTWRLTMTYPLINAAREVLWLVTGADKAPRLAEVLGGPLDPRRLPSQGVRPFPGRMAWYLDPQRPRGFDARAAMALAARVGTALGPVQEVQPRREPCPR